ncbi:hypothetical protein Mapa_010372 [Marchantia paleacea]|nr:hypothetical protein Mapa_010372 [Marchantia paleacea]
MGQWGSGRRVGTESRWANGERRVAPVSYKAAAAGWYVRPALHLRLLHCRIRRMWT